MDVLTIAKWFDTQEACIEHLEKIRFGDDPFCPRCGVVDECARKTEKNHANRWNCHACKSTFNVLTGTIFQGTHIPLPKWFAAIALIMNAKKSMSSYQLERDLGLNQKTAWYMQQRIRPEIASKQGKYCSVALSRLTKHTLVASLERGTRESGKTSPTNAVEERKRRPLSAP